MYTVKKLNRYLESRGDLHVIEDDLNVGLNYKYYYVISDFETIVDCNSINIIVIRGSVNIDNEKVIRGDAVFDIVLA